MLTDTHAHIHFDEFTNDLADIFENCIKAKVDTIVTVGTDDTDSAHALSFVTKPEVIELARGIKLFAAVGLHPHEAKLGGDALLTIKELVLNSEFEKVLVAVGECGLDYYKNFSSKQEQHKALEFQIELALDQDLPLIFHVRDAWDDFFGIIKNYPKLRGVIHSFTGDSSAVERAGEYNLYFGLNGIMTFTKDQPQLDAAEAIPADKLLLETDCPFLTPVPVRGKRNEPSYVAYVAQFLADLRNTPVGSLVKTTSTNAAKLFGLLP